MFLYCTNRHRNYSSSKTKLPLFIQVGDMIDIIAKPSMGIWTGMLNGKIGNFKFIYVDAVVERAPEPVKKMRSHKRSPRPQPRTLQELLQHLNLEVFYKILKFTQSKSNV